MELLNTINLVTGILITLCFLYQWFYVFLNFVKKPKKFADAEPQKYAVLISARNEETVIKNLIHSIQKQNYPKDLLDVYVVADNCTDSTATVAKDAGAIVLERFNTELKGKGFALNELIHHIWDTVGQNVYDGYFVFDADNLLDENFVKEMNKAFSSGNRAVTSYRNSKNFTDSWISGCSGTWLLRETGQWNAARTMLGISSSLPGTGFLVAESILIEDGGFISETITEDIEFHYRWVTKGEKIVYCDDAIFYDEQPSKMKTCFRQLLRWSKGNLQCYVKFFGKLFKGLFSKKFFSCADILFSIIPAALISIVSICANLIVGIDLLSKGLFDLKIFLSGLAVGLISGYVILFLMSFCVMITERKRINCPIIKRIWYSLLFPLYLVFYTVAVICSIFAKVKWTPIEHKSTVTIDDINSK